MKKSLSIVRDDLRSIRRSVITSIMVFFIMVIPMVFAVFNVLASWKPFENTEELRSPSPTPTPATRATSPRCS